MAGGGRAAAATKHDGALQLAAPRQSSACRAPATPNDKRVQEEALGTQHCHVGRATGSQLLRACGDEDLQRHLVGISSSAERTALSDPSWFDWISDTTYKKFLLAGAHMKMDTAAGSCDSLQFAIFQLSAGSPRFVTDSRTKSLDFFKRQCSCGRAADYRPPDTLKRRTFEPFATLCR
ncbi:hypothetical protein NFI96_009275 [Prochilodus magdalenae]|nr:hypothetical protein NFI96_009275 [Prochilodus magdalenae]